MNEQIFISYSSLDMNWALTVKRMLEGKGYSCWMANSGGINPGENYAKEIAEALDACPVFLLILSPNAEKSPWVPKELNTAISARKHVIPFQIIPSVPVPFAFQLENIQILTLDKMHKKDSLEALANAVALALSRELSSIEPSVPSPAHTGGSRGPPTAVLLALIVMLIVLCGIAISLLRKRTEPSPQTTMENTENLVTSNAADTEGNTAADSTEDSATRAEENPAAETKKTSAADAEDNSAADSGMQETPPDLSLYDHVFLHSQHIMEGNNAEILDEYTNSIGEVCEDVTKIGTFNLESYASYYLGGKYDYFTATISCPDDVGSGYSYDFLIWLDGDQETPVYQLSMGRSTGPTSVSIDLSGHESITFFAEKVSLAVSGALISDGLLYYSQDAANETASDASAGSSVSDIPDGETETLFSQHIMEGSNAEALDEYTNSIGEIREDVTKIGTFNLESYASYYLGGKYDYFTATISCPDDVGSGYTYDFMIWLDGDQETPVYQLSMGRSTGPTSVSIDLSGHESITFFAEKVSLAVSGALISDGLLYYSQDAANETASDASAGSSVSDIPDGETETLFSQHIMEGSNAEALDEYTNSIGEVREDVTKIGTFNLESYASYYLGGKYDYFTATISCPDDVGSGYTYDFLIWLDGDQEEPVYQLSMGRSTSPTPVSIDLSGHESITFFAEKVPLAVSGALISDGLLYLSQP